MQQYKLFNEAKLERALHELVGSCKDCSKFSFCNFKLHFLMQMILHRLDSKLQGKIYVLVCSVQVDYH